MKHKIALFIFALAMLMALRATPAYAGDNKEPPPCSQCDGGQVWSG